jgi:hypothetical protein
MNKHRGDRVEKVDEGILAVKRRGSGRWTALSLVLIGFAVAMVAWLGSAGMFGTNATQAVPAPELTFSYSCSSETAVGGSVKMTYTVENTGAGDLTNPSVVDDRLLDISGAFDDPLVQGASDTVVLFYIVQAADLPSFTNNVSAQYDFAPQVQASCTVGVAHLSITKTLFVTPQGVGIFTFVITNDGGIFLDKFRVTDTVLGDITDEFPNFLAPGQSVIVVIERPGITECSNQVTATYETFRGMAVKATAKCTPDGQLTFLEVVQIDTRTGLPFDEAGAPLTFFICQAVVALCDGGNADITTQDNPFGPVQVDPDTYTACVVEPAGFEVDAECKQATVPLGGSVTFTFFTSPIPDGDEGCTPGFWRNKNNGRLLWDQATDAIPIAIGAALGIDPAVVAAIDSDSDFYLVFMVPAETAGLPADPFTTDDAIRLGGGHEKKLARHGMAALLNAAAVNFPLGITEVKELVKAALESGNFEPLATDLDGFNNLSPDCPANNN